MGLSCRNAGQPCDGYLAASTTRTIVGAVLEHSSEAYSRIPQWPKFMCPEFCCFPTSSEEPTAEPEQNSPTMVDTNRFDAPITACHASFADKAALLNTLWGTQHSPKALQTGEIDSGPYPPTVPRDTKSPLIRTSCASSSALLPNRKTDRSSATACGHRDPSQRNWKMGSPGPTRVRIQPPTTSSKTRLIGQPGCSR